MKASPETVIKAPPNNVIKAPPNNVIKAPPNNVIKAPTDKKKQCNTGFEQEPFKSESHVKKNHCKVL